MKREERLATALASFGNLFVVITAPELRRRALTPLAFYALQRSVQEADQDRVYSRVRPDPGEPARRLRYEPGGFASEKARTPYCRALD